MSTVYADDIDDLVNPLDQFRTDVEPMDVPVDAPPVEHDEAPAMVAPRTTPPTQEELEVALAKGPILAGDFWDLEFDLVEPEFFPVEGGSNLMYRGMSHLFVGEPGRGKSMILQKLVEMMAKSERFTLFIDLEKAFPQFRERLRALGATKESASRIGYWHLPGAFTSKVVATVREFCATWNIDVVVIDAWGRALSRGGLDENNNDDVRRWYDAVIEPLIKDGRTPAIVDHFKKQSSDDPRSKISSRFAKGAGAKLDVITGAAYGVEFSSPFSRKKEGRAKLINLKNNNGAHEEGECVAEVIVTPSDEGRVIDMRFVVPTPVPKNDDGSDRRTGIMENLSKALEKADGQVKKTALAKQVGGNASKVGSMVDLLVDEGFFDMKPGSNNSKLLTSLKPYRQAEDPKSDRYEPV